MSVGPKSTLVTVTVPHLPKPSCYVIIALGLMRRNHVFRLNTETHRIPAAHHPGNSGNLVVIQIQLSFDSDVNVAIFPMVYTHHLCFTDNRSVSATDRDNFTLPVV